MISREAKLPFEVVMLIIAAVVLLVTGVMLFLIYNGILPYYENGLYGLLLIIFALNTITLGRTPFGDIPRGSETSYWRHQAFHRADDDYIHECFHDNHRFGADPSEFGHASFFKQCTIGNPNGNLCYSDACIREYADWSVSSYMAHDWTWDFGRSVRGHLKHNSRDPCIAADNSHWFAKHLRRNYCSD